MTTGLTKTTKDALLELAPSPIKALAILFGGLLGRPNLDEVATAALQEDVARLYARIEQAVSALTDETRAKIDAIEAMELSIQTVSNMGRTAHQEKRAAMANVLVHGLMHPEKDATERRLFVRAVADLDVAHVDLLRRLSAHDAFQPSGFDDRSLAMLAELLGRGLVSRDGPKAGAPGFLRIDASTFKPLHRVSELGCHFLDYLRETTSPG